ncbi:MAG: hypothetical protein ACLQSR_00630 [Limisphaerales bacterium]
MTATKMVMLVVALAMICMTRTAQATIVLGPTTVDVPGTDGAAPLPVDYYVSLSGTTYTYYFVITPPAGSGATSFTVDISDPATVTHITSTSSAYVPPPVIDDGVSITWNFNDLTGTTVNSFQSQFGPGILGMSGATGINGTWVDPPASVPEASTIIAGMLMILPLGAGIFRSLGKGRNGSGAGWANVPIPSKDVPSGDRRGNAVVA